MGQQDDTRPAFGLRFSDLLSVSLYHVEEAGMMKTEEPVSRSWDYIGVGSSATSKPNLDVADAGEVKFKVTISRHHPARKIPTENRERDRFLRRVLLLHTTCLPPSSFVRLG